MVFSLCESVSSRSSLHVRRPVRLDKGSTLLWYDLILTNTTAKTQLPNKIRSEVLALSASTYLFCCLLTHNTECKLLRGRDCVFYSFDCPRPSQCLPSTFLLNEWKCAQYSVLWRTEPQCALSRSIFLTWPLPPGLHCSPTFQLNENFLFSPNTMYSLTFFIHASSLALNILLLPISLYQITCSVTVWSIFQMFMSECLLL